MVAHLDMGTKIGDFGQDCQQALACDDTGFGLFDSGWSCIAPTFT